MIFPPLTRGLWSVEAPREPVPLPTSPLISPAPSHVSRVFSPVLSVQTHSSPDVTVAAAGYRDGGMKIDQAVRFNLFN